MTVNIVAQALTAYFHCQLCEFVWQQAGMGQKAHAEQMANNLADDVMNDYRHLSDWIIALVMKHGDRLAHDAAVLLAAPLALRLADRGDVKAACTAREGFLGD